MSDDATQSIDREQLYKLVWRKPLSALASELGISDVGLAKLCDRVGVPRPRQGYWVRLRNGTKETAPALPPAEPRNQGPYALPRRGTQKQVPRSIAPDVTVRSRLSKPHPVTRDAQESLRRSRADEYGVKRAGYGTGLPMSASGANLARAVRILDAFVKALEGRGFEIVTIEEWGRQVTVARLGQETIEFSIKERLRRVPHRLTPYERESLERTGSEPYKKFDLAPTGDLSLRLERLEWLSTPRSWSDGKKTSLEDKLGEAVVGVELAARELKTLRVRREADQARAQEVERQRRSEARRRELERRRNEQLREMAIEWHERRIITRFLDEVEEQLLGGSAAKEVSAFVAWARSSLGASDASAVVAENLDRWQREDGLEQKTGR